MGDQLSGVLEERSVMLKLTLLVMVVVLQSTLTADAHMLDQPSGDSVERSVMLKLMLSVMVVVLLSTHMEDAHMLDQPSGVSEEKSVMLMLKLTEDGDSATTNYLATLTFQDPGSVTIQVGNNVEPVESDQLDGVIITMLCQVTPISKDLE